MKKECKIIQDLLPAYIEKQTKKETNQEIEEHLKNCKTCTKEFNRMKREIDIGKSVEEYKTEINKMKQKMKRIKWTILSIILIILVAITIDISYKYSVITQVVDKNINFNPGDNYKKTIIENGNSNVTYYKDGIAKLQNEGFSIWYFDNSTYMIDEVNKTYYKDAMGWGNPKKVTLFPWLGITEDTIIKPMDKLVYLLTNGIKIYEEEYNQEKYIIIKTEDTKIWINKTTYIADRQIFLGQSYIVKFEQNVVTDNDLVKPDLSQYKELEIEKENN